LNKPFDSNTGDMDTWLNNLAWLIFQSVVAGGLEANVKQAQLWRREAAQ
jgi:hypothetical protein